MNAPAGRVGTVKHFLDLSDFDGVQLSALIAAARARKAASGTKPRIFSCRRGALPIGDAARRRAHPIRR